jgi:GNAT superfamily N-acetyltransferase
VSVEVRRLTADDALEGAAQLFDQYRQFYQQPSDLAACRTWLAMRLRAGQSAVFLATLAGRPAGFMQLYPGFCSIELAPIWTLYDLFTAPAARGQGVASRLLDAAADFGRREGAAYLQLATAHDNFTAQRLYARHGWVHDTVYRTYTRTLHV